MKTVIYPQLSDYPDICTRPHIDLNQLNSTVEAVLNDVKERGDAAVLEYESRFDHVALDALQVTEDEIESACSEVSPSLWEALVLAHQNISKFHESQVFHGEKVETA